MDRDYGTRTVTALDFTLRDINSKIYFSGKYTGETLVEFSQMAGVYVCTTANWTRAK